MTSHWDSEYAIWRDLSVVQGREVPAQINNVVAHNQRPPRLTCNEETEEQFFKEYTGGGDYRAGPDLNLIQKMIQAAADASRLSDESPEPIKPNNRGTPSITITKKPKNRNVAITSLLLMHGPGGDEGGGAAPSAAALPPTAAPLVGSASMFKRKTKVTKSTSPQVSKSDTNSEVSEKPKEFVPSSRAAEYYIKYHEQSEARARAQETVWSRAEKQMQDVEARRKMGATSTSGESSGSDAADSLAKGLDIVRLPADRHSFTDAKDCLVCKVLCSETNNGSAREN